MFASSDLPDSRRRAQRFINISLAVGLALIGGVVGWYVLIYQPGAVDTRDAQYHRVVCTLADPAKPAQRALRAQEGCRPVKSSRSKNPHHATVPVHVTPTAHATSQSRVAPKPSTTPGVASTRAAVPVSRKRQTASQGRPVPSSPATTAATSTAVTGTPSARPTPIIGPVCSIVPVTVLCSRP